MDLKQLEDAIRAAGTSPAETKTEAEIWWAGLSKLAQETIEKTMSLKCTFNVPDAYKFYSENIK